MIPVPCLTALYLCLVPPATGPVAPPDPKVMYARYIDMDQGNATLLEFSCGAVLIDAGGESGASTQRLLEYLDGFFNRRKDLHRTLAGIIITHNHPDHTRSLEEVAEHFTVLNFIENGQRGKSRGDQGDKDVVWLEANSATDGRHIRVFDVNESDVEADGKKGYTSDVVDPVACTGTDPKLTILSADLENDPGWGDAEFGNKNNHSIVIRVDFGEASFLYTGDLEEPGIVRLVEYYSGTSMLDADVWEVGHHGSYNGTTEDLLKAMSPHIAVISMGHWNDQTRWSAWSYGHPRKQAVLQLELAVDRDRSTPKMVNIATAVKKSEEVEMRRAIFATGWDGTITVRATSAGEYRVIIPRQ